MQPAQITFSVILGLNLLTALILGINTVFDKGTPNNKLFLEESPGIDNPYRFTNPKVAYEIWTLLDVFEGNDTKEVLGNSYNKKITGFEPNFNYCNEHRLYVVNNPEFVFEPKNYFSNYWKTHKLRTQVIPAIGNDVYPGLFPAGKVKKEESKMRTDINLFYTYNLFYYFRKTGTQFSCISQASNHIPGHDKMYRKDKVGQALVDYAKGYAQRPECFNYDKYFIKTWVLHKKDQCKAFFKEFNSQKYQDMKEERNVVYFRKIGAGVHEGKGVFPVNDKEENYIRTLYANGTKCGKVKQNNLIQYNVYNLLLLDNRKFGFRMFMLVASTNPVIAYYHDGYARLSLNEYDPNSGEKKTFVTNIGVNLKEATQGTFLQNMTNEQIQEYTFWTLEDVTDYLVKHKRVESHEWLENHLRPEFRKVMTHLIRMTQSGFYKKSSLFELYGLDFVMDVDLNLWFIEANSMPLVNGFTKRSTIMMNQMLKDAFDIVLSLAKSRIKRVIEYVNMLSQEVAGKNKVEVKNLEMMRLEYKELTKNYFEPEFTPRANNTFYKIIDENESGVKRFSNLIDEKCL